MTSHIQLFSTTIKLGSAPYLTWGHSWNAEAHLVNSLMECTQRCKEMSSCHFGTYVSAGNRERECWLTAAEATIPYSAATTQCGVPCTSFVKLPGEAKVPEVQQLAALVGAAAGAAGGWQAAPSASTRNAQWNTKVQARTTPVPTQEPTVDALIGLYHAPDLAPAAGSAAPAKLTNIPDNGAGDYDYNAQWGASPHVRVGHFAVKNMVQTGTPSQWASLYDQPPAGGYSGGH